MSNVKVTIDQIIVHGRGSVVIDYKVKDSDGVQVDISTWLLYFEVDQAEIREPLTTDPEDPLGRRIVLERTEVEQLLTKPTPFAVINENENAEDIYKVLWSGTIHRVAYIGDPDKEPG